MAVNTQSNNNVAYGLSNALQNLSPLPIIAKRAPKSTDIGEVGQQWIFNNNIWEYTSASLWLQLVTSGASSINALTISAPSITLNPTSGALSVVSNKTSQSGTFTAVNNAMVGTAVLTGNTLAQNATQLITLTNSNIALLSGVMIQVTNTNVSAGAALLTINGMTQAAGSLVISVTNKGGAGGLGTTDSIILSFMVLS